MSESTMESVALQHEKHIKYEQEHPEMEYRTAEDYLISFAGLKYFFNFLRHFSRPNVLDIGAGNTQAAFELSQSDMGKGLEFYATSLTPHSDSGNTLNQNRTIITPAETLAGIQDEGFGGALSCYGVAYSEAPKLVAQSLDRILKSDGIFKGVFPAEDSMVGTLKMHSPEKLKQELSKLNFGVFSVAGFLTAIKGGGDALARDLFLQDATELDRNLKTQDHKS